MWIVEMHRVPRPAVGYDNFGCPSTQWEAFLGLGKAYGWQPKGLLDRSNENREGTRDMRYIAGMYGQPGGWLPLVEADDAKAWAEALDRAATHMEALKIDLPKPKGPFRISKSLTPEQHELLNGGIRVDHIRAFTAYLHQGAFDCAYDD